MSGSGNFIFPQASKDLESFMKQELEKQKINVDVNNLIRELLPNFTRDSDKIRDLLDQISETLEDEIEMEKFLFGGSVAKHTYVDGLSDIDALVLLNKEEFIKKNPQEVLNDFYKLLKDKSFYDNISSIEKGTLAVTIKYMDGIEIQLLPAIKVKDKILISKATTDGWKETRPLEFRSELTRVNQELNNSLIPLIKIAKSIIADFPKQKRLTGYHIESLAVNVFEKYKGEKTYKEMLNYFFSESAKRILNPIKDSTGQSRIVDDYLGSADSLERKTAADELSTVSRRMNSASSIDQWKQILGLN